MWSPIKRNRLQQSGRFCEIHHNSTIEGIKNRDIETVKRTVDEKNYTKFDDWPPFNRQGSEALKREADVLRVLKE